VLNRNPTSFEALRCRAAANCMLFRFVESIDDAERALYLFPGDESSWLWKGVSHFHLHEYAEAAEAFRSGLQYQPTHARLQRGYNSCRAPIPVLVRSSLDN
jgi:tetratricopeptide (TPR) repeat protein